MPNFLTGGYTPPIRDSRGQRPPRSIASVEKVRLGGLDQWVILRGHDTSEPHPSLPARRPRGVADGVDA